MDLRGADWEGADNGTRVERDRERALFYATYDVMTGVRIAATLGGFFALMVFLIVYKSRSKSVKAMNDPKLVELAEAVVAEEEAEEEERALSAVLEEAYLARGSLGGGARFPRSLPPRRLSCLRGDMYPPRRGDSLPGSALLTSQRRWSAQRDRRLSSATCSSSGSGYLERRPDSVVCALGRQLGTSTRLAPLASAVASFAVESELPSVGADSVFADDDTDEEVEQFSTDSGGGGGGAEGTELSSRPRTKQQPTVALQPTHSRETLF